MPYIFDFGDYSDFSFSGCAMHLVGSWIPNQGSNLALGSESMES